jgi:hypothetical protein
MEFKGTKGAWAIENLHEPEKGKYAADEINISSLKVTDRVNMVNIATVWHTYLFSEDAKANALLISKAPEMLSMLQRIYSSWYTSEPDEDLPIQEIQQLIKEATEL